MNEQEQKKTLKGKINKQQRKAIEKYNQQQVEIISSRSDISSSSSNSVAHHKKAPSKGIKKCKVEEVSSPGFLASIITHTEARMKRYNNSQIIVTAPINGSEREQSQAGLQQQTEINETPSFRNKNSNIPIDEETQLIGNFQTTGKKRTFQQKSIDEDAETNTSSNRLQGTYGKISNSNQFNQDSPFTSSQFEAENSNRKRQPTEDEMMRINFSLHDCAEVLNIPFSANNDLRNRIQNDEEASLQMMAESDSDIQIQNAVQQQQNSSQNVHFEDFSQQRRSLQTISEENDQVMSNQGEVVLETFENLNLNQVTSQTTTDHGIIECLKSKDRKYEIDPNYLNNRQRQIEWHMRVLLLDWMMEVCDEFGLKRETFHLAVYFIDLFLTRQQCSIDKLQLLGASSLLLSCKIEEVICPRVRDFQFATDNGFTQNEIVEMEGEISRVMEFQLYPITLNFLANYLLTQWDQYVKTNPQGYEILNFDFESLIISFKSDQIEDYQRFRSVMQVLDLMLLDLNSFQFEKAALVSAAVYIQLGINFQIFVREQISTTQNMGLYLRECEANSGDFDEMIDHFIYNFFNLNIQDLFEVIPFVAKFFSLETKQDMPIIIQSKKRQSSTTQEEFYSYQVHVKEGMEFVKHLKDMSNVNSLQQQQQLLQQQSQLYYNEGIQKRN